MRPRFIRVPWGSAALAALLCGVSVPACSEDGATAKDSPSTDAGTSRDSAAEAGASSDAGSQVETPRPDASTKTDASTDADATPGAADGGAPLVPGRIVHLADGDVQGDVVGGSTRFV